MPNKRIERLQILDPCLKLCKKYLGTHILQYKRLDALDSYHISGSPDIEIWVPRESMVWILMCECKKPDGGILSPNQKDYRSKYSIFKNVIYIEITDVFQLKQLVLNTSDYGCADFEEFKSLMI